LAKKSVEAVASYSSFCASVLYNKKDDNEIFKIIFEEAIKYSEEKGLHKMGDNLIFKRFVFSQTFGRFEGKIDFSKPVFLMIKRMCWIIYNERIANMSNAKWEEHLEKKNKNGHK